MSARSYLLLLVAVSAVCFATARKEAAGNEVTGRSLKQWGTRPTYQTYQPPQPVQTTQPTGEAAPAGGEGTTATQTAQPTYGGYQPLPYGGYQPHPYGGYQPHPYGGYHTRNPYNSYCGKDMVPATDDIYKRKACVPEYLFSGAPEPAPAD